MRRAAPKTLRRNSTPKRLGDYLEANPDEELTVADAMKKFSVSREAVYNAIDTLRKLERAEHVHVIRAWSKGRPARATGWLPGPGPNGGAGGCDVEVAP